MTLEVAVERTRRRVFLGVGQGYLLDNWRWATAGSRSPASG
ncbi:hypothetical protein [Streptomyces mashuensis]|nr:hypothetical protein [Streptomyces mashuensis]